jgi:phenylalanine-4-hydroxylase
VEVMMESQIAAQSAAQSASLRGDYSEAGADYVIDQRWEKYTSAEHALYRRLYERQMRLLPGYACDAFLESLAQLDAADGIPRFDAVSKKLRQATGWELVAVPGLVPDLVFFDHLAHRRFPVTNWLRKPAEFDYIVEPDVFHDFFGHVPLLFDPTYANYMEAYGQGGLKAARLDALSYLARLYWYTVEFGLLRTPQGLRIYGAGILSSGGEVVHSLESMAPRRVMFRLERLLRTEYLIDRYQDTYFVIDDFERLIEDTAHDFASTYERVRELPSFATNALVADDVIVPPNPTWLRPPARSATA